MLVKKRGIYAYGMYNYMVMRCLIIFCLLLVACGPQVRQAVESPAAIADLRAAAEDAMEHKQWQQAAASYSRLSALDAKVAYYRLRAAEAYFYARDLDSAERMLMDIDVGSEEDELGVAITVWRAKIMRAMGKKKQALQVLSIDLSGLSLSNSLISSYYALLAELFLEQGRHLAAIDAYLMLLPYADDSAMLYQQAIWDIFSDLGLPILQQLRQRSLQYAAWSDLAILYKTMVYEADNFKRAIDVWLTRFPGHPAYQSIVPGLIAESEALDNNPTHIALLLPLSALYEPLAAAIREGFLAAWYADSGSDRAYVSVYDTSLVAAVDCYAQALADGADFIVGPLQKENIQHLLANGALSVPTLFLNVINDPEPSVVSSSRPLYFALSPETEARAVAEQAWIVGHTMALAITPKTDWGMRIYKAFSTHWQALGGKIVANEHFQDSKHYAKTVKSLLNISDSERRAQLLRSMLGVQFEFKARRRQDADFIFLAASSPEARQIVPLLAFYQAGNLPIYASSHIYAGYDDPDSNDDLNGVNFVDIPWLLDPSLSYSLLQQQLNDTWSQQNSKHRQFYAFGVDAYRLITAWPRLLFNPNARFAGMTGTLRIDKKRHIQRSMQMAKFIDGKAVLQK